MRKILVTGASGFIGLHCLHELLSRNLEDVQIHAVTRTMGPEIEGIIWHRSDLLSEQELTLLIRQVQPTDLLHLAWYLNPQDYKNSPQNIYWLKASLTLVELFCLNRGKRIVATGTCFEYAPTATHCHEDITLIRPTTLYGTCKHALSKTIESFVQQKDINFTWARPFYLFGPGEAPSRFVPYIITSFLQNQEGRCFNGQLERDFLYVKDVAKALIDVLISNVATGYINIGSGSAIKLGDLATKIAHILASKSNLNITINSNTTEPIRIVADNSRLKELMWKPAYDLDEALHETIAWWKEMEGL